MKITLGKSHRKDTINFGLNYKSAFEEIDDGECTEIHAPEILDYIPEHEFRLFIDTLVNKMRHGCELTIGGSDLYESMKQLFRGDLNVYTMNNVLYGNKEVSKRGQYSMNSVSDILLQRGLKILEKNMDRNQMYIKAVRE